MKVDIFCHIAPPKYMKAFEKKVAPEICQQHPSKFLPGLSDLDVRFRVLDNFEGMVQVLTLVNPPVETIAEGKDAVELAQIANDEMAELVAKYPDRFVGAVACLPMNDLDAAIREADRAIKELKFCGIQLFNTVNGKTLDDPEFMPLYQKMAEYDLPIWIHPFHPHAGKVAKDKEDFASMRVFTGHEDFAWALNRATFGLPSESAYAITRLVYSKVFDTFPTIKFILHHCGSYIPYLYHRLEVQHSMFQGREQIDQGFKKPILDYFRMFYVDSALHGNARGLMCGVDFYGIDHILFGTDMPFDEGTGLTTVRKTVAGVDRMDISEEERAKIYEGNAKKLLRLKI